jgi:hypothetical protein
MSLKERLRKLEKSLVDTGRRVTDSNGVKSVTLDEASAWVTYTMSEEHRDNVVGENWRYRVWWETNPLIRRGQVPSLSHLTMIFNRFVQQAARMNLRPFTLPPAVTEVYLKDLGAYPDHECQECGYQAPVTRSNSSGEVKRYFPQCPLCGGTTGEELWHYRTMDFPYSLMINSEIYNIRRMQHHTNQLNKLRNDPKYQDAPFDQLLDVISKGYPDIRRFFKDMEKTYKLPLLV